jgi:tetratricopeptide (TPR) repeat protein
VQAKFDVYYDALSDFLQEITDVRSNYYIAYPYEKADFSNLLDECEEHFRSGDYELAVEKLSVIPKTSKYYSEALLQIALCKYFLDEEDDCVKTFDKLIKLYPTNVYALCNAISINNKIGNKTKVKNYREKFTVFIKFFLNG